MTKNQLIKKLSKIKGNPLIIVSADSEGNSFCPLNDISPDLYWDEDNRELRDKEDFEESGAEIENYPKCIVLWPG